MQVGPPHGLAPDLFAVPPQPVEIAAAGAFAAALAHTFAAPTIERLAHRHPGHARWLHPLGEVELVFGFWAAVLLVAFAALAGALPAFDYAQSRSYAEPVFVFVVMVIAGSRPVLHAVRRAVAGGARVLPLPRPLAVAWLCLAAVPLTGSLITEPAAMTIAALALAPIVFRTDVPEWPKYFALGVLLVNISIGGMLTSYAAPPVLMVTTAWGWDSAFMLQTFGWKAALGVLVNASAAVFLLRRHLVADGDVAGAGSDLSAAPAVVVVHLLALAAAVWLAHEPLALALLVGVFVAFVRCSRRHQDRLLIREALLVAVFLAGLVLLGGLQRWWLQPLVAALDPVALFFGALGLTAITDNAALTYLGAQIAGLSTEAKYMLVAGAVAGGGLTVIANAPNPAGLALVRRGFADETVGVGGLLLGALAPTAVAAAAFLLL